MYKLQKSKVLWDFISSLIHVFRVRGGEEILYFTLL